MGVAETEEAPTLPPLWCWLDVCVVVRVCDMARPLLLLLLLVVVALKYAKFKPYSDRNKILDRAKQEKISKLMDRME